MPPKYADAVDTERGDSDIQVMIVVKINHCHHVYVWSRIWSSRILCWSFESIIIISKKNRYTVDSMIGNNNIQSSVIGEMSNGTRSRIIVVFNWIFDRWYKVQLTLLDWTKQNVKTDQFLRCKYLCWTVSNLPNFNNKSSKVSVLLPLDPIDTNRFS